MPSPHAHPRPHAHAKPSCASSPGPAKPSGQRAAGGPKAPSQAKPSENAHVSVHNITTMMILSFTVMDDEDAAPSPQAGDAGGGGARPARAVLARGPGLLSGRLRQLRERQRGAAARVRRAGTYSGRPAPVPAVSRGARCCQPSCPMSDTRTARAALLRGPPPGAEGEVAQGRATILWHESLARTLAPVPASACPRVLGVALCMMTTILIGYAMLCCATLCRWRRTTRCCRRASSRASRRDARRTLAPTASACKPPSSSRCESGSIESEARHAAFSTRI